MNLYTFGRVWNVPDASPFCVKLETWLRMSNIEYCNHFGAQHIKHAPKGKLPFIELDGQLMGDSQLIIRFLSQRFGNPVDQHLTDEQKAITLMVQRTLDEHCYFGMVYSRWIDPANWPTTRDVFFTPVPRLLRSFIAGNIQKKMAGQVYQQGTGRHTKEDIYQLCCEDLQAVLCLLGDNTYFFGEQPSSIDALIYSYFCNFLYPPAMTPMKQLLQNSAAAVTYTERMQKRYFNDLS